MTAVATPRNAPTTRRAARTLVVAAASVPVLVVGQFAMLAVVPVVIVLVTTLRNAHLRPLRWWAAGLAAAYALPLIAWALGPDRAPSLSKDMHPALAVLIVVAAGALLVAQYVHTRRTTAAGPPA